MAKLLLEIISPEKTIVSVEATMVVLPGTEGRFAVLHGHEPYIAMVQPGVVEISKGDIVDMVYIISSGVVEVTGDACYVIVDEAMAAGESSPEELEEELKLARNITSNEQSEIMKIEAENRVKYLETALEHTLHNQTLKL